MARIGHRDSGPGKDHSADQKKASGSGSGDNERLAKMIESGKARLGDGYHHGYTGPKAKGQPVSCSEFIDSIRKDAGLNPFCSPGGTKTAWSKIAGASASGSGMGGGAKYQKGKEYPAGTLFVAVRGVVGDGTHVAMSIGGGKVLESVNLGQDRPGPRISSGMSGFYGANVEQDVLAGVMPDVGTSVDQSIGEAAGDVLGAAGDMAENIFSGVSRGIAAGLVMVLKYIYGKVILQPLDFFSGFWWEFLKHFVGAYTGENETEKGSQKHPSPKPPGSGGRLTDVDTRPADPSGASRGGGGGGAW
jgi:hypothetical protein